MGTDNLLATLENTLRQTRAARARLSARLVEVEREAASLRAEIDEMDALAQQTEATMYRFMSAVLGGQGQAPAVTPAAASAPSNFAPPAHQPPAPTSPLANQPVVAPWAATMAMVEPAAQGRAWPGGVETVSPAPPPERGAGTIRNGMVEAVVEVAPEHAFNRPLGAGMQQTGRERFAQLTIPQATAALLRETGGPLHVNEIYEQLLSGGFVFSGHNPTISSAVSLNRNPRFRKVSRGTFDLVMRDAAA
jgi:hypothetical protein